MRAEARRAVTSALSRVIEQKRYDTNVAYQQIDRAGYINYLVAPAQGVGITQRVGDAISIDRLELRLDAYYNAAAISTDVGHKLRVIILQWNIDNLAVPPGIANILENGGASVLVTSSPYNWQGLHQKDFTILFDKSYALNHAKDLALRATIPMKKSRKVQFGAGLTTGEGIPYILLCADDVTGAHTPDIQVQFSVRGIFTDA